MKARGRMNHTLGPTALIHFTRHKCHGQEFTLAHITNTNAQQTHNNEYRYRTILSVNLKQQGRCIKYVMARVTDDKSKLLYKQ